MLKFYSVPPLRTLKFPPEFTDILTALPAEDITSNWASLTVILLRISALLNTPRSESQYITFYEVLYVIFAPAEDLIVPMLGHQVMFAIPPLQTSRLPPELTVVLSAMPPLETYR